MICAKPLVRHMLWCANTFCLIIGVVMALLCILFMDSVLDFHLIYCIFGLIVGLLTSLAASSGYYAMRQSGPAILWLYCALLTILFITQLYIVTHFQASSVITSTMENLHVLWEKELKCKGPMASIESRFHCCGLNNYTDYTTANMSLPDSCFYTENDSGVRYNEGCLEKVTFAACRASKALSITGFTLTAMQVLAVIFSTALAIIHHRTGGYEEVE